MGVREKREVEYYWSVLLTAFVCVCKHLLSRAICTGYSVETRLLQLATYQLCPLGWGMRFYLHMKETS